MAGIEKPRTFRPEGGSSLENVRLNAKRQIKIDHDFQMPAIHVKEVPEQKSHRCCMCGRVYSTQHNNFPKNTLSPLWKGNNGFIPFCKTCVETLMNAFTSLYTGNEEHALRHLCCMFDWFYCDTASSMTLAQAHHGTSRALMYPSKASTRQVMTRGRSFVDTLREEDGGRAVIVDAAIAPDEPEQDGDFVVTKDIIRRWGKGYTAEQYEFLEEEYGDWCAKNVCNTKSLEELYKNIAIAQLNIRVAMKTLQDLMNSANILPKQIADSNNIAETQSFGTLLKKFEETRPVPEAQPEWRDIDGIRKYMNTWVRGGLGKALRVRNEHTALYDEAVEEMERYTVRRDSFDGAAAEGLGSAIFDEDGGASGEHAE